MSDPIEDGARAAARRLTTPVHPDLADDVEAALYARGTDRRPGQYTDPVALASLIVAIASQAWTMYQSHKTQGTPSPPVEVVVRHVRDELTRTDTPQPALTPTERNHILEVTVTETLNASPDADQDTQEPA